MKISTWTRTRRPWILSSCRRSGSRVGFSGCSLCLRRHYRRKRPACISRGRHLRRTNRALAAEVEERKRIQVEVEQAHKQLLEASRQAGMAEVATNVLHNVGNVLNSVNVSAGLLAERVRKSRIEALPKAGRTCGRTRAGAGFLGASTRRAKRFPAYLKRSAAIWSRSRAETLKELGSLQHNINHIKEIVAMQQEYSRLAGFTESVKLADLVEDALRLNEIALRVTACNWSASFTKTATVVVEKHKVLQILVNLIRNAKYACDDSGKAERQVAVRTSRPGPGPCPHRGQRQRRWHSERKPDSDFQPGLHHAQRRPRLWTSRLGQCRQGNGRQPGGGERRSRSGRQIYIGFSHCH